MCRICFESQDSQTLAFKGMQLWTLDLKRSYTFLFSPVLCVLMECGWSLGEGVKFHFSRGLKIGTGTIEYVSSAHIFGTLECTCSWTGGARYIFRPIRVFLFPLPLPFPFHRSWFYKQSCSTLIFQLHISKLSRPLLFCNTLTFLQYSHRKLIRKLKYQGMSMPY